MCKTQTETLARLFPNAAQRDGNLQGVQAMWMAYLAKAGRAARGRVSHWPERARPVGGRCVVSAPPRLARASDVDAHTVNRKTVPEGIRNIRHATPGLRGVAFHTVTWRGWIFHLLCSTFHRRVEKQWSYAKGTNLSSCRSRSTLPKGRLAMLA